MQQQGAEVSYEKHITALRLMDAVIATKGLCRYPDTDTWGVPYFSLELSPCHEAWDELFTFINANFEDPKIDTLTHKDRKAQAKLCSPYIDNTFSVWNEDGNTRIVNAELEAMIRSIPPVILDIVWPVSIARFLMRDHWIPLNHRMSSTFAEFDRRYGAMIRDC